MKSTLDTRRRDPTSFDGIPDYCYTCGGDRRDDNIRPPMWTGTTEATAVECVFGVGIVTG
jgi:hypothetical protein